jgi:hypothetical protein
MKPAFRLRKMLWRAAALRVAQHDDLLPGHAFSAVWLQPKHELERRHFSAIVGVHMLNASEHPTFAMRLSQKPRAQNIKFAIFNSRRVNAVPCCRSILEFRRL